MGLNAGLAGKRFEPSTYEVTHAAIEAYARATNDFNPGYFGDDPVASPVFPIVPVMPAFMAAAADPDLGADLLRLVHGAQEHVLHRPLRPGDVVAVASVLESVDTGDGNESFTVAASVTDERGPAALVRGTMVIRQQGRSRARPAAPKAPEPADRPVVHEETSVIDDDQTFRYADASGDRNPIHLDDEVARAAGLPGIVNHGMCTMAMAVKAAVDGLAGGDPARIARVAARFRRPVFPGQEITTRLWRGGGGAFEFETYGPSGRPVITGGVVELA